MFCNSYESNKDELISSCLYIFTKRLPWSNLPRAVKHYKMRGWSKHFVVKIYICEWEYFIPQVWRKISEEKNTNKCNFCRSHDFCGEDTFCFGAKPQDIQDTLQFSVDLGSHGQGETGSLGDEEKRTWRLIKRLGATFITERLVIPCTRYFWNVNRDHLREHIAFHFQNFACQILNYCSPVAENFLIVNQKTMLCNVDMMNFCVDHRVRSF